VRTSGPRYTEAEAREAIASSRSYSEALRRLGMRAAGGNHRTIRRYAEEVWRIPVDHFDPDAVRRAPLGRPSTPLAEVLVERSAYPRGRLKERLFADGLKSRRCELCGQGELWQGRRMALILDHVNGIHDDNRLENLRIVCANCNATLETHCGRNNRLPQAEQACLRCGTAFLPRAMRQRYCSRACGQRAPGRTGPQPARRRVPRPPYEELLSEIDSTGYSAAGRKYGVSGNAIRKWRRAYEAERASSRAADDVPVSRAAPAGLSADASGEAPVPAEEVSATDRLTAPSL
jgi:transposase-like protein